MEEVSWHEMLLGAAEVLKQFSDSLTDQWPDELPPESVKGFWAIVHRAEQRSRSHVTAQVLQALSGQAPPESIQPLDAFFVRRRIEWANQMLLAYAEKRICPPLDGMHLLEFLLVRSWDSDGAEGLRLFAQRGGPSPDNPDGQNPLGLKK